MSNLTPEMQAELDKLRDIRLPDPVGWWPPRRAGGCCWRWRY